MISFPHRDIANTMVHIELHSSIRNDLPVADAPVTFISPIRLTLKSGYGKNTNLINSCIDGNLSSNSTKSSV